MSSSQRRSVDKTAPRPSRTSSIQSLSADHDAPPTSSPNSLLSRQPSAAFRTTTVGRVMEATLPESNASIAESNSNAISVLLQQPILRTGLLPHTNVLTGPKPPSSKDIPPVTLSNIPPVDNQAFRLYLQQADALYNALQRAKDGSEDGRPRLQGRPSQQDVGRGERPVYGMQRRSSSQSSVKTLEAGSPVIESSHFRRRSSAGATRRAGLSAAPLSTIPSVYFEEDFHLENPRTFDVVSEKAEIARPPNNANGSAVAPISTGKKALAANAILQEKLSWYMDTVEIHLISSISTASTSFFAALGSLRELHVEAAKSVERIVALREDLNQLDEGMAAGGLKILALKRRRENLCKLGDAVRQLERIVQSIAECESQVDNGEVDSALKGLVGVEMLLAGEPPRALPSTTAKSEDSRLIDLRGLKVLEGAQGDITFLRKRIGKAFEAQLIQTLVGDLKRHIDGVPQVSTFQRWDKASSRLRGRHVRTPSELPSYLHVDGDLRATLHTQLKGLARSDSLTTAAMTYRESILREIKKMIQRHLPSSDDDDVESSTSISTNLSRSSSSKDKSSILMRNVRSLDAEDAEAMFKKAYSNVGEALRRLGTQVKLILDITSNLNNLQAGAMLKSPPLPLRSPTSATRESYMNAEPSPGPPPIVHQEEIQQALDLSSLLGQAVDIAQNHIVKLLRVRKEQTNGLETPFFLRYFALNRLFADECEAVSGRAGVALKSVVQEHIKIFVARMAERETQRLIEIMDADKWDARDFTCEDSQRLDRILESSTRAVDLWTTDIHIWDENSKSQATVATNGVNEAETKSKTRSAVVDEEKFMLPESAISALAGIEVFARLLAGIPNMAADISGALLDYLKQFKSRSSQLVLGAGATRSAGLKNITTKHLAISSQATSFIVALVPYLREFARRHMPSSTATGILAEFDKVKRSLQEQQGALQDKFVEIMAGRANAHVTTMASISWDSKADGEASPHMVTLVKETTMLHKVLGRYLSAESVRTIIGPVLVNYREQLGPAFRDASVKTPAGKARLLRDAEYFKARSEQIEGARELGDYLCEQADRHEVQNQEPAARKADEKATGAAKTTGTTNLEKAAS